RAVDRPGHRPVVRRSRKARGNDPGGDGLGAIQHGEGRERLGLRPRSGSPAQGSDTAMTRSWGRLFGLGLVGTLLVPSLEAQTVSLTGTANTTSLRWGKMPGVTQFQVTRRQSAP